MFGKYKRKLFILSVGMLTIAGLSLTGIPRAAAISDFCAQYGTGYCLNDWNNGGYGIDKGVKMYTGGTTNEGFIFQEVNRCGGHDVVTSSCPGSSSFNQRNLGEPIGQIRYGNLCVADTHNDGDADLGYCNDPFTGTGGSTGTIFVLGGLGGNLLVNLHWSGTAGTNVCLESGGSVGAPVYLTGACSGGSDNWGYYAEGP